MGSIETILLAGETGEPIVLDETEISGLFAKLAGDVLDHVGWRRRHSHTTRSDTSDS